MIMFEKTQRTHDKQMFIRVLSDPLSNAVKYSHGNRAIQSRTELSLHDEGIGISEEEQQLRSCT